MKKIALLSIMLSSALLCLVSCAGPQAPATRSPTAAAPQVLVARDAALGYVSEHFGELAPGPGRAWMEERVTPPGLVGAETYRYTTEEWQLTISYPIVPPESTIYHVTIEGVATAFLWEGEVDAQGTVQELGAPEVMLHRIGAREAALAYIREQYEEDAPPDSLSWQGERITAEGVVGTETYQYEADGWVVTVSYPVVAPPAMVYLVVVTRPALGFEWRLSVDAQGVATEEVLGQ